MLKRQTVIIIPSLYRKNIVTSVMQSFVKHSNIINAQCKTFNIKHIYVYIFMHIYYSSQVACRIS